jgi:hypothetical protein
MWPSTITSRQQAQTGMHAEETGGTGDDQVGGARFISRPKESRMAMECLRNQSAK